MPAPSPEKISAALDGLRELMKREKENREGITISPESIERLRELPARLRSQTAVAVEVGQEAPATVPQARVQETAVSPAAAAEPAVSHASPGSEGIVPPGATKAEKIAHLRNLAEKCETCRNLGSLRDVMVFSVGNPDADLMLVGEAPGFEEEKQREPFVGPAGQKLNQILQAMGLNRPNDVYISNIVKFRPIKGDPRFQGSQNRKPTPEEMSSSIKYVMAEIEVVRPKAIVALGGTAAEGLLDQSGSVGRMRNQFHDLNGIPVMVTYHPSYLLRAESQSADGAKAEKRKVWEDMLLVMEKIGLPISEKQRGFFR